MYIPQKGLSHSEGMELVESLCYLLSRGVPDNHRKLTHESPEILVVLRMLKHHASFGSHVSPLNSIQRAWDTNDTSRVVFTYQMLRCLDRVLDAFHRLTGQSGAIYDAYVEPDDYHRERRKRQLVRATYSRHNSPILSYQERETVTLPAVLETITKECNLLMSNIQNPSVGILPDVLREKGFKTRAREKREKGKKPKQEREATSEAEFYKSGIFDFVGDFEPCRTIIKAADDAPTVTVDGKKSQVCLRSCGKEFQGCGQHKGNSKNKCKFFHFPNDGSALPDKVDAAPLAAWAKLPAVKKYIKPTALGKELLGME